MAFRRRHGWQVADDGERCPNVETRMVGGKHGVNEHERAVRCTRDRHHDGKCRWRGVEFGVATA